MNGKRQRRIDRLTLSRFLADAASEERAPRLYAVVLATLNDAAADERDIQLLAQRVTAMQSDDAVQPVPLERPTPVQYVTLDQMAAVVHRSKRTLEKRKGSMPLPDVEGGGGKPDEWLWQRIKPWLEAEYGRSLPASYPSIR